MAIIGIGCRFPGDINSPASFWNALIQEQDCITEVPPDRWNWRAFYDPQRKKPGTLYTKRGGFLKGIDQFDPEFFGISPREAAFMDPQQRLLLEVTWEAFEDAGTLPEDYRGKEVGVFTGLFMHDYENLGVAATEYGMQGPHSVTGLSTTIAANRVSYCFDFTGPSMVIDTACSSSLVAVHLACQSIAAGECSLAVAGGVNAILKPEMSMSLCKASMLSPDGYCKAFDADADGYVRSEGAGMILIKSLSQALKDKDHVYAVIKGSAVNQDGNNSDGITMPNGASHEKVVKTALKNAQVAPADVQYVEAHGTGTAVGDPIEARALGSVFSKGRTQGNLKIGSVKTNLGHAESAAGVAGIIKVALMLKNSQMPANLHFHHPNPGIAFSDLKLQVSTTLSDWHPGDTGSRIAGINSFGFGGTNAHLIVEEFPADDPAKTLMKETALSMNKRPLLFPLSAHSANALDASARRIRQHVESDHLKNQGFLEDLCRTNAFHRTHHPRRLSIVAHTPADLVSGLSSFLNREKRTVLSWGNTLAFDGGKIAFVYSGMGQQWWAMGRELFAAEPVFRDVIIQCDALFRHHTGHWSLKDLFTAAENSFNIDETRLAQPAIFSLQAGLTALWKSWGIVPDGIIGHSVGEIAAAHASGALSLKDAVKVCYHRSRLQHQTAGQGKMLAVGLSCREAEERIHAHGELVSVAAVNSPDSVTLSGDGDVLETIAADLEKNNIFARFLKVDVPYHSPVMDVVLDELRQKVADIGPMTASIPLVSTVSGDFLPGPALNNTYWLKNVRNPVLFADGVETLMDNDFSIFIEIGAHPVLATSIRECFAAKDRKAVVLPSLRRRESEQTRMLNTAGSLYTGGVPIQWEKINGKNGKILKLFPYPFQRSVFWNESDASRQFRRGERASAGNTLLGRQVHPLLGSRLKTTIPTWHSTIDLHRLASLKDHRVQGTIVYPGAAYIEMGIAAAGESTATRPCRLEAMEIKTPLVMDEDEPIQLQTIRHRDDTVSIFSNNDGHAENWTLHASGKTAPPVSQPVDSDVHLELIKKLKQNAVKTMSRATLYDALHEINLDYGPDFQAVETLWLHKKEVLGRIRVNPSVKNELNSYLIHPSILDACFQLMAAMPVQGTYLPVAMASVNFWKSPAEYAWGHAKLVMQEREVITADIKIIDDTGNLLMEVNGLACRRMSDAKDREQDSIEGHLYEYQWILSRNDDAPSPRREEEYLLPTRDIKNIIAPEITRLFHQHRRRYYYDIVRPDLERLCISFIVEGLKKLGISLTKGAHYDAQKLIKTKQIVKTQLPLFHQLFVILEKNDVVKAIDDGKWACTAGASDTSAHTLWQHLLMSHPAAMPELLLMERCGSRLHEVLTGAQEPLPLLFARDATTIEHFYEQSFTFGIYNQLMQQTLMTILAALPEGRVLRILEVGAGTGGTTSYVLPLLPVARVAYTFSDISTFALNQAKQKFQAYAYVDYRIFDMEKDGVDQGFSPHSFDMIIASNALHATSDLKKTLTHLQGLLSANGMLMLSELTGVESWLDIVFGMLEGWWLFSDVERRPSHPLLSRGDWVDLLTSVGFTAPVSVDDLPADTTDAYHPTQQIYLAGGPMLDKPVTPEHQNHASRPSTIPPEKANEKIWLLSAGKASDAVAIALADNFAANGKENVHISTKESVTATPDALLELLDEKSEKNGGSPSIVYLRSIHDPAPPMDAGLMETITTDECCRLLNIYKALGQRQWDTPPSVWIITNGVESIGNPSGTPLCAGSLARAPLWGLGRVAISEFGAIHTRMVDIGLVPRPNEIAMLCNTILADKGEDELCLRGRNHYVRRALRQKNPVQNATWKTPYQLIQKESGVSTDLSFHEAARKKPGPGEVEIQVIATGINFKDVARINGLIDAPSPGEENTSGLGLEGAGIITSLGDGVDDFDIGDPVFGLIKNGFSNYTTTDAAFLGHKPGHLSFEEAATIPVAFLTAFFSFHTFASIKQGDRVLIHTGSGGVGLAALQIAKEAGAEIFATAGTQTKRSFLRALGLRYVGDSRSVNFTDEIMEITENQGIDIVLNTLAEKGMTANFPLLKPATGKIIDLGNMHYDTALSLKLFQKGIAFYAFDLTVMVENNPSQMRWVFNQLIQGFHDKKFHPLPHRIFPVASVSKIFKSMGKGRHIGKLVASHQEPGVVPVPCNEKLSVNGDGTYVITGGMGGFGLSVAEWLVSCGARSLALVGRSGASTPVAMEKIKAMEKQGAQICVIRADVSKEDAVKAMLTDIQETMPPLKGIIHGAMVLEDKSITDMTPSDMKKVLDPKIRGAWNLHLHTLDAALDFFICFSSISAFTGNMEQSNYSAANYFLDAFAFYRKSLGLPALTISWGTIGEVGYVVKNQQINEAFERQGLRMLSLKQAWVAICCGIEKQLTHMGAIVIDWNTTSRFSIPVAESPRFSILTQSAGTDKKTSGQTKHRITKRKLPENRTERLQLITQSIAREVAGVLGMQVSTLDPDHPMELLGFDSLMAVELNMKLEKIFNITLPKMAMLKSGLTVSKLSRTVMDELSENSGVLLLLDNDDDSDGGGGADKDNVVDTKEPPVSETRPPQDLPADDRTQEVDINAVNLEEIDGMSVEEVDAMLHRLINEES